MEDRPIQFSLRTFLIVFTIAGLTLRWYARSWRQQRDRMAAMELFLSKFGTQECFVRFYGDDNRRAVVCTAKCALTDENFGDLLLIEKGGYPLAKLFLEGTPITDEGLEHIVRFPSLEELVLSE